MNDGKLEAGGVKKKWMSNYKNSRKMLGLLNSCGIFLLYHTHIHIKQRQQNQIIIKNIVMSSWLLVLSFLCNGIFLVCTLIYPCHLVHLSQSPLEYTFQCICQCTIHWCLRVWIWSFVLMLLLLRTCDTDVRLSLLCSVWLWCHRRIETMACHNKIGESTGTALCPVYGNPTRLDDTSEQKHNIKTEQTECECVMEIERVQVPNKFAFIHLFYVCE